MIVVISRRAERDLDDIRRWIGVDNPERALSYARELRAACADLRNFPHRFPRAPQFGSDARRRLHGNYHIIYRADAARVTILAIVHTARDF